MSIPAFKQVRRRRLTASLAVLMRLAYRANSPGAT
jgi:hypothetical protein